MDFRGLGGKSSYFSNRYRMVLAHKMIGVLFLFSMAEIRCFSIFVFWYKQAKPARSCIEEASGTSEGKSKTRHKRYRVLEARRRIKNGVGYDVSICRTQHPGTKKLVCSTRILHPKACPTPSSPVVPLIYAHKAQHSTPNTQHPKHGHLSLRHVQTLIGLLSMHSLKAAT
jgi:hypothetical protein